MSETAEATLLQGWYKRISFKICSTKRFFFVVAIKESLQKNGTLGRFKGEIRAAVMNVLNKNASGDCGDAPKIPEETKLINELIREYLVWNGYLYSEQILAAGKTVFLTWLLTKI